MHHLKLKKPLAFFDLETTGINIIKDRIVEICIVKALPNGNTEVKTKRINPTIPIPTEASMIHGIYDEDLKDAPPFKNIAKDLYKFLEGCDLAGFNVLRFDVPMLVEEFLRADINFEIENRRIIDAQKIFHMMEPRNLSAAYKFYCGKELEGAHGAEADTLATYEVLNAQVARYEGVKLKNEQGKEITPIQNDMDVLHELTFTRMVDLAGRMMLNNKGEEMFNFGKYKGQLVKEVLAKDPNYFHWMQQGDFPLDTKRKLTQIKLRDLSQK